MRIQNPNQTKPYYKALLIVMIIFMMSSLLGAMACFIQVLFTPFNFKLLICGLYFTAAFLLSYKACQNY